MRSQLTSIFLMCLGVFLNCLSQAGGQALLNAAELELPQTASRMAARVDELLDQKLQELGWQAAPPCNDASFLRRAHLDLTGAAPTASEVLAFIENPRATKRNDLVEGLLASPSASVHLAKTWSSWLLPESSSPEDQIGRGGLEVWLRRRFAENLRYDRLVADLLVSTGTIQNSPTAFFVALESKPEKIAAKTARVFLGVQLDCAECHNHPFDDWKQTDFWGFAAYFARLSSSGAPSSNANGDVTDVATGEVKLPGTEQVIAPKPLVETGFSGLATGTRRQQLTLWLTAPENPFLARAAVNRAWALLFGRGLVEPIDDMRSLEMASHPQLLEELSNYFVDSNYDLRGLLAMLASTKAYQRATKHPSGIPPEASYAVMATKPLTEIQLATCLSQVARQLSDGAGDGEQRVLIAQLGKLRGDSSQATLGIVQALVTLHGAAFDRVSRDGSSLLLQALGAPHMDDTKRLQWLFLSTLNRQPTTAELAAFSAVIHQSDSEGLSNQEGSVTDTDAKAESAGKAASGKLWQSDLLWALLNSTDFAMTP